jgi:hypothetical protein
MTDRPFERDLGLRLASAFRSRDLPAAPGRLLDALERVVDTPLDGRSEADQGPGGRTGRRTALWLVGVAAAVALGGALVLGGVGRTSDPRPPASAIPSGPLGTVITYGIEWTDATPASAASLARVVDVIRRRLDATGIAGATVRAVDPDHVAVGIPAGLDATPFRRVVGQVGTVTFVPLGDEPLNDGDEVDPVAHPALFGGEGVADAAVGAGQVGERVVTFELTPLAAARFADYTETHIGDYFAIAIDGRVVTAPRINSAIPGGSIEITKGGEVGGYPLAEAQELVAVLRGPLPVPIREVSVDQAPVDPAPSRGQSDDPAPSTPPSTVSAGVDCGPPLALQPETLTCDEAVGIARAALPAGFPAPSGSAFHHACPEIPGAQVDCAIGGMGVVTFTFGDGAPPLRIEVGGGRVRILDGPGTFALDRETGDFGCDTIRSGYRSFTIEVAATPARLDVTARTDRGARLAVQWGPGFQGLVGPPPAIVDGLGGVIRSGDVVQVPDASFPSLAGHAVCPGPDLVVIFDEAPPS